MEDKNRVGKYVPPHLRGAVKDSSTKVTLISGEVKQGFTAREEHITRWNQAWKTWDSHSEPVAEYIEPGGAKNCDYTYTAEFKVGEEILVAHVHYYDNYGTGKYTRVAGHYFGAGLTFIQGDTPYWIVQKAPENPKDFAGRGTSLYAAYKARKH
ncbi:MAG TPA: hypothetical protein VNQ79_12740 [Blastocatellia bacterium]|nr:hypothetical protein [Blastocatellia bacterium]